VFREGAQDIAREAARENARKQRKLQAAEFREPIWAYLSGMIDRRLGILQSKHYLKSH